MTILSKILMGVGKRGWKYGVGAGLFKRGADTFPISFFQVLSFLHLEITFVEQLLFAVIIIL